MVSSSVNFTFTLGFTTESIRATELQILLGDHILSTPDLAYS